MEAIFIVAAKRTPFGTFGGKLKSLSPTQLGLISTQSALSSFSIDPSLIDSFHFGNVIQSTTDSPYLSRHIALQSGCRIETPSLTINRLCGSGFESAIQGIKDIRVDGMGVVVCGGVESMSRAPLVLDGKDGRWGVALGKGFKLKDALWDGLTDSNAGLPMGMTAENLAVKYGITREECDEYAIRSQTRWNEANENGIFEAEMAPVEVKGKKGKTEIVDTDEHPRPSSTVSQISKLPPVFQPETGVVTAANASGICDGAGTIILASESACTQHDLKPLARIASHHVTGCDPNIMGIGPVEAIRGALAKVGIEGLGNIDRVEINEAFASQVLACAKELQGDGLEMEKLNVNGGAISLGHPLGASGSRILAHLANEYQRTKEGKHFVGSACIGGGQGIAVVLERV